MKKVLLAGLMLVSVGVAGAAPVLFEAYQEGQSYIPEGEDREFTITEVSFSVDSACYVQFAAGGYGRLARVWFELDGDSLPPGALCAVTDLFTSFDITYTYLLDPGEHTISLQLANYYNTYDATLCRNSYLQALVFVPDAGGAVAEPPKGDAARSEIPTPSVISQGPYVNVAGASELVDATGRVIKNAIRDDKVFISSLSTGTYFARNGERTVVKIVKVE